MQERSCRSLICGFVTTDVVDQCPKCGRRMRTATQIRVLGALQLALGLFLAVFMGIITVNLAPLLLNSTRPQVGSRFTGTPEQAAIILGLFALIIVFGLGSSASGIFLLVTGRRNKWIIWIVLGLGLLLFVIGAVVRETFVT